MRHEVSYLFDMLPTISTNNTADGRLAEPELFCDLRLENARVIQRSNFAYLFVGQLRAAMLRSLFGNVVAALHHVGDVLRLRTFCNVVRVKTPGMVASVATFWHRFVTVQNLESRAMREDVAAGVSRPSQSSIALFRSVVWPRPALLDIESCLNLLSNPVVEIYRRFELAIRSALRRTQPTVISVIASENMQRIYATLFSAHPQSERHREFAVVQLVCEAMNKIFLVTDANQGMIPVHHSERL